MVSAVLLELAESEQLHGAVGSLLCDPVSLLTKDSKIGRALLHKLMPLNGHLGSHVDDTSCRYLISVYPFLMVALKLSDRHSPAFLPTFDQTSSGSVPLT